MQDTNPVAKALINKRFLTEKHIGFKKRSKSIGFAKKQKSQRSHIDESYDSTDKPACFVQ
ncbi:hypothetical protein AWR27_12055 [Spirosoma montaniterrae]|uniref:Uncharacterized protein n=1 Tax=Spirosoma montaniterrae TaxID=1178516 RepID=A0A1P9WX86_9BACT|nr:hypothetical protein AWR27_12055 [Spirosoma montaniterrae]